MGKFPQESWQGAWNDAILYQELNIQTKENGMKECMLMLLILLCFGCQNGFIASGNTGPQGNQGVAGPQGPAGINAPAPTPEPTPASSYLGCFIDNGTRSLPNFLMTSGATVEGCIAAARALGQAFAGVEYGVQCFSGNTILYGPAFNCSMPCQADPGETCGGDWSLNVYSTGVIQWRFGASFAVTL
jgi:WSC domain